MLSIDTDYITDGGCPAPYLKRIAEAGFSHVSWCHHWNTDFVYCDPEVEQIAEWLGEFGLTLLDLHASAGVEKGWVSLHEYERLSGIELVQNRIEMTARLGGDVIVLHVPGAPESEAEAGMFRAQLRRSLNALEPFARGQGVRIAIENGFDDDFVRLRELFDEYVPDYLGLCYDCGHGNLGGRQGLDHLECLKSRLIAVHLHDNDGSGDQHNLPFCGTVDWPRLCRIIAASAYTKCVSLEVLMGGPGAEYEQEFLAKALEAAQALSDMIEGQRE